MIKTGDETIRMQGMKSIRFLEVVVSTGQLLKVFDCFCFRFSVRLRCEFLDCFCFRFSFSVRLQCEFLYVGRNCIRYFYITFPRIPHYNQCIFDNGVIPSAYQTMAI